MASGAPRTLQQRVGGFEEKLVQVEIRGALAAEGMRRIAEADGAAAGVLPPLLAGLPPSRMKLPVLAASCDGEAVLALGILVGVAEGARGVAHEVRLGAEVGVVVQPAALHGRVLEVARLLAQRLLLAVGAVEGIDLGGELLGDGLGDVPRRIPQDRIEARARIPEHVRELQLPMEEAHLRGDPLGDGPGLGRRVGEAGRQRGVLDLLRRPEPAGAPQIHRGLERAPCP